MQETYRGLTDFEAMLLIGVLDFVVVEEMKKCSSDRRLMDS